MAGLISMMDYWTETIALLQPAQGPQLVSKPTLKPDLLQKVPFKFLHDVIAAVRIQFRALHVPCWCVRIARTRSVARLVSNAAL